MSIKLPFGLRYGELIHISEITEDERGLKCNCICPHCKQKLSTRIGKIRTKHFKHEIEECKKGVETALHLFAKEVLQKHKKIKLPKYEFKYTKDCLSIDDFDRLGSYFYNSASDKFEKYDLNDKDTFSIGKNDYIYFDEVKEEERSGGIIADIIVYKNGIPLIIEIAVTHYINNEKYNKIVNNNMSCLQIELDTQKNRQA